MDATVIKQIKKLKAEGNTDKETVVALARAGVQSPRGKPYSLSSVRNALYKGKGKVNKTKRAKAVKASKDCDDCLDLDVSADLLLSGLIRTGSAERAREALQNALLLLG